MYNYEQVGQYTITLTISSSTGVQRFEKVVTISKHPKTYRNQYEGITPDTLSSDKYTTIKFS